MARYVQRVSVIVVRVPKKVAVSFKLLQLYQIILLNRQDDGYIVINLYFVRFSEDLL